MANELMQFVCAALKRNPQVAYADVRDSAVKAGITQPLYPITFGRAKAVLGQVEVAPRGQGNRYERDRMARLRKRRRATRAARKALAVAPAHASNGHSNGHAADPLALIVQTIKSAHAENVRLREAVTGAVKVLQEALAS